MHQAKELADLDQQPPKTEILISLDQSTDISGYAIFINKKLEKYGHTKFVGDYLNRIAQLRQWLVTLLEKCKVFSIKVAIEDIQLQHIKGESEYQNIQTFHSCISVLVPIIKIIRIMFRLLIIIQRPYLLLTRIN